MIVLFIVFFSIKLRISLGTQWGGTNSIILRQLKRARNFTEKKKNKQHNHFTLGQLTSKTKMGVPLSCSLLLRHIHILFHIISDRLCAPDGGTSGPDQLRSPRCCDDGALLEEERT